MFSLFTKIRNVFLGAPAPAAKAPAPAEKPLLDRLTEYQAAFDASFRNPPNKRLLNKALQLRNGLTVPGKLTAQEAELLEYHNGIDRLIEAVRSNTRDTLFPKNPPAITVTFPSSAISESAISESAISESAISESAISEAAISEAAISEAAISENDKKLLNLVQEYESGVKNIQTGMDEAHSALMDLPKITRDEFPHLQKHIPHDPEALSSLITQLEARSANNKALKPLLKKLQALQTTRESNIKLFNTLTPMVSEHELRLLEHPESLRVFKEFLEDNQRHLLTPERVSELMEQELGLPVSTITPPPRAIEPPLLEYTEVKTRGNKPHFETTPAIELPYTSPPTAELAPPAPPAAPKEAPPVPKPETPAVIRAAEPPVIHSPKPTAPADKIEEALHQKSGGKAKWVLGGILAAGVVIGAFITPNKNQTREDARRDQSTNPAQGLA